MMMIMMLMLMGMGMSETTIMRYSCNDHGFAMEFVLPYIEVVCLVGRSKFIY